MNANSDSYVFNVKFILYCLQFFCRNMAFKRNVQDMVVYVNLISPAKKAKYVRLSLLVGKDEVIKAICFGMTNVNVLKEKKESCGFYLFGKSHNVSDNNYISDISGSMSISLWDQWIPYFSDSLTD